MMIVKKTLLYLSMAGLLLNSSAGITRAANHELPFHGSVPGPEVSQQRFPELFVQGSGTGHLTHMGRVTATWMREGSLVDGSQTASYEFVAANGDKLFVDSVGQADLSLFPDIHVVEIATIAGGTGRFEGATGTLMIERIVVLTGPDTTITSQEIEGFINMKRGK